MKKKLSLILLFILVLSTSSCALAGNNDDLSTSKATALHNDVKNFEELDAQKEGSSDKGDLADAAAAENVTSEAAKDKKIAVTVVFDYPANDVSGLRETEANTLEEAQALLKKIRESNKEYHSTKNNAIMAEADISYYSIEISSYSPFVFIVFNNEEEYKDAEVKIKAAVEKLGIAGVSISAQ